MLIPKETIMTLHLNRRGMIATVSASALAFATGARAQDKPLEPWQWTDRNGLIRDLPKDKEPLKDELKKYPRCRYCGMERAKFSHSRHLLVYEDDSAEGTCSIHCSRSMTRSPSSYGAPVCSY